MMSTSLHDAPAVIFEGSERHPAGGTMFAGAISVVVPSLPPRPRTTRLLETMPPTTTSDGKTLSGQEQLAADLEPVAVPPLPSSQPTTTVGLWLGSVDQVEAESLVAHLVDLEHGRPEEVAEFDLAEIAEDDRALVRAGATFFWSITRVRTESGRVEQRSELRFRRLLPPSEQERASGKEWAAAALKLFRASA
jgi:hypothetical protein